MPRKRKEEEFDLYDWYGEGKKHLRYVGRSTSQAMLAKDPGVPRYSFGAEQTPGGQNDNLCKMFHAELLMGEALEDAKQVCGPKPDDFIFPDRFVKRIGES